MLKQLKSWLGSSNNQKRIESYAVTLVATFGLGAITFAATGKPVTWALILGALGAGGHAVYDVVKPVVVGWLTKNAAKSL